MSVNRVVVVDDDGELRSLLEEILVSEGYQVSSFFSPRDALQELCEGKIGEEVAQGYMPIILSDHLMPGGMSGVEFLREARKAVPGIPFILMTAFGSDEVFLQSKKFGATSFVRKPFSLLELFSQLRKARAPAASMAGEAQSQATG